MKYPLVLLLMLAVFVGCDNRPLVGRVVDKSHTPMRMQPMMIGKVMTFVTHPEIFSIKVQRTDGSTGWQGVNTTRFNSTRIGDEWPPIETNEEA